jgi:hypothetical protein
MASETGIRAGKAYVELFADNSKLVAGMKRSENQVRAFGNAAMSVGDATRRTMMQTGEGFNRLATFVGAASAQMGEAAGSLRVVGGALGALQSILMGPIGWISLATGAAMAAVQLLTTKDAIEETTEAIERQKRALAKKADWEGREASGAGAGVLVSEPAAAAEHKWAAARKDLADATRELEDAQDRLTAANAAYLALNKSWREAGVAVEGQDKADAEAAYTDAYDKAQKARALEARRKERAKMLAAREIIPGLLDEMSAAVVEGVAAKVAAEAAKPLAEEPKDIFPDNDFEVRQQNEKRAMQHRLQVGEFVRQQEREIARLKIEGDEKLTKEQKARALLELQQAQQIEDLWLRGPADEEAEAALEKLHAMQLGALGGAQAVGKQTTAGTFSAFAASRMGGSSDQQRIVRANEKQLKVQEDLLKELKARPALALK